jgi:hypothetical protein
MGSGALLQYTRGLGFWINPVLYKNKQDALSLALSLTSHLHYLLCNCKLFVKMICMILSETFFSPCLSSHCNELFEIFFHILRDFIESILCLES